MNTLPSGDYKPGATFDSDGRRWHIDSVAHTGRALQAHAYGYPWRYEEFKIDKMNNRGYLQHSYGTAGPFRTESVPIRNERGDRWQALFEGRWRRVHIRIGGLFIVYRGERIRIKIEGV